MRTITAKGGPLDGKTYEVPDTLDQFDGPEPDAGHYKVNEVTATWQATPPAKKAAVTRAKKAATTRARNAETTGPADAPVDTAAADTDPKA